MTYQPKVLLVDDEADHLHLLTVLLRKQGFDIYSISNPDELPKVVKQFKPELILLDVSVGQHDGKRICKELKADPDTRVIKVILHSAFPQIADEYKLCGADEFILKPADIFHLTERLNFHLKKAI